MLKVDEKEIKGYQFADGVHWYWGEREVAVINQSTSEIEWCERKCYFPQEVVDIIRSKKPKSSAKWIVEAKRISDSVTQGEIIVQINDETVAVFSDNKIIGADKKYHSQYSDEELGKFIIAAFWHKHDDVYHYSDKAKNIFYSKWKEYQDANGATYDTVTKEWIN